MKIRKVITSIELNVEDLTFMLTAANISGYMEANEKIVVSDDLELTDAIVGMYSQWLEKQHSGGWGQFVEQELFRRFGTQNDEV